MSDPFRRLFLDQVERIIQKEPSSEMMLALLQLASPELESLGGNSETSKMFKILLARVHPDKHPQEASRATRLCQDARIFYGNCMVSNPTKGVKRNVPSPSSVTFPLQFNAISKWSHILYNVPYVEPELTRDQMSRSVAYQCINARGAIAHRRHIELKYDNHTVSKSDSLENVEQVFKSGFGGAKELIDTDAIKEELMQNGPVVSTSFRPSDMFMRDHKIGKSNNCHQRDILIVGWQQLSSGEVWIVQPLSPNGHSVSQVAHVALGQFGLDECCLAPMSSLDDTTWQLGPYYNANLAGVEEKWLRSPKISFAVESLSELDSIFKEVGTTIFGAQQHTVTVRNKLKKAHSRKAKLYSAKWDSEKKKFMVTFKFI